MNLSRLTNRLLKTGLFAVVLAASTALAQLPGSPSNDLNAVMVKLLGNHNAFTAKAEVRVLDKTGQETDRTPMTIAMLDGRTRLDVDASQIQSKEIPAAAQEKLKQQGMSQSVILTQTGKKGATIIYPQLNGYTEMVVTNKEATNTVEKNFKVDKTKLGKQTLDGHNCEKTKVTLTDEKGEKQEAIVFYASDLKGFPIQMELKQQDDTVIIHFTDVKLGKPDPKLFEVPAGLTKFSNEQLMKKLTTMGDQK